jgi:predicted glycogen debranching enzyme
MEFDLSREWLESNGIGGYACSTVIGCNTRRYHALLCAAMAPPLGRMVLVNKADETLSIGNRHIELGCNQFPGAIVPGGYHYLESFELAPLPRWIYRVVGLENEGDALLEKTLWMPYGQNRTCLRYRLLQAPQNATFSLRPYVTARDYHHSHRYNSGFDTQIQRDASRVILRPYDAPVFFGGDGEFYEDGAWYYCFEYAVEMERGLDCHEDAYCPGAFVWQLKQGESAYFEVSTEPLSVEEVSFDPAQSHDSEIARREKITSSFDSVPAQRLALAADQFIVRRSDKLHTVLAGYPWFSDWGRDTMIALPGLCLSTQRFDEAASILRSFAKAASEGMIPNRFPDSGEIPDYNTVDATLWFFHAAAQYAERSGDWATIETEIYPVLRECTEWHIKGTRYGIKADESDGLLSSGGGGTQLTWMDAKVGDWVVTPREGKAVEIQALWFNALKNMEAFAARFGDETMQKLCAAWSERVQTNFAPTFWNDEEKCLYDYVHGTYRDGAIRPNQIFAVSLPHRLLNAAQEKAVVACVQRDLLTPHGLRSLSPRDSRYRGIYIGDQWQRDGSYHQGTVWGWLMGPFLSAYLKVNNGSDDAKTQARAWLEPLIEHLDEACFGSISEIFDGDAPHTPRGCFAQAWSVSETLRVLVEQL